MRCFKFSRLLNSGFLKVQDCTKHEKSRYHAKARPRLVPHTMWGHFSLMLFLTIFAFPSWPVQRSLFCVSSYSLHFTAIIHTTSQNEINVNISRILRYFQGQDQGKSRLKNHRASLTIIMTWLE